MNQKIYATPTQADLFDAIAFTLNDAEEDGLFFDYGTWTVQTILDQVNQAHPNKQVYAMSFSKVNNHYVFNLLINAPIPVYKGDIAPAENLKQGYYLAYIFNVSDPALSKSDVIYVQKTAEGYFKRVL